MRVRIAEVLQDPDGLRGKYLIVQHVMFGFGMCMCMGHICGYRKGTNDGQTLSLRLSETLSGERDPWTWYF
jgi:hypothetical protein